MRRGVWAALLLGFALGVTVSCGSSEGSNRSDEPSSPAYEPAPGEEVDEEDLAQEEWDSQGGEAWDEFTSGYIDGWDAGCDVAFEGSPDGSLYDQGIEYTVDECYDLSPGDASSSDYPIEPPDDPYYEGEALGETDGCVAAFDELSTYGVLNWGEDSYDESVCP
jgi:hypothetical protein